jgi:hypothetical protein
MEFFGQAEDRSNNSDPPTTIAFVSESTATGLRLVSRSENAFVFLEFFLCGVATVSIDKTSMKSQAQMMDNEKWNYVLIMNS